MATNLENSVKLETIPVGTESVEQSSVADLPSPSPLKQSGAAAPLQKVRKKKVDNGDNAEGTRGQNIAGAMSDEPLIGADQQHAASEPRVGGLGESEGAEIELLASTVAEGTTSDAKGSNSELGSSASVAEGDHSNGTLSGVEVAESSTVKASEVGTGDSVDEEAKGGWDGGNSGNAVATVPEEASAMPSYVQLDPSGFADEAGSSPLTGVSEGAEPIDGGAGASGDVSVKGLDVSESQAGMQNGVGAGDVLAGVEAVGMSDTVPLLSSVSGIGTGEAEAGEPIESVSRVSESAASILRGSI